MQYVLGLDLGTNSLGWAIIRLKRNKPDSTVRAGVRIFEAGVEGDIERGKDSSRAAKRREARQPRRQNWRRQYRKQRLFVLLKKCGLLPGAGGFRSEERKTYLDKIDAELTAKHIAPTDHAANQKLPYYLRSIALEQKLEPVELGRVLYNLAARRGFLSNRKGQSEDDDETGKVKAGISELGDLMGDRTLGQTFNQDINPRHKKSELRRIRKRYTGRQMYQDEFARIRDAQAKHFPKITKKKWKEIEDALFFQRPLKSQKHLVGKCELEPSERRCPEALPIFQEFRILQAVNHLKITPPDEPERFLTEDEREALLTALQTTPQLTFKTGVRKAIGAKKGTQFSLEEWEPRLVGHRTNAKLMEAFGDLWLDLSEQECDDITLEVLHYRKAEKLIARARSEWRLTKTDAETLARARLEEGYARHSRKALVKLVARMRDGTAYSTARQELYGEVLKSGEERELLEPVRDYDSDIRNPAVIRAMTELRKVVNGLIREYGKPKLIRVELARDLKNSRDRRKRIWENNNDRRRRRERAVKTMLDEHNHHATRADIEKWLLAEECNWTCPYTGKAINAKSLIGQNPSFDVEHIYPRRYLDDSFTNKTLCFAKENRDRKRDMLPFEAFSHNEARWEEILDRVRAFKGPLAAAKLKRFETEEVNDDFTNRHLNDTRYNSVLAAQYLGTLYGGRVDAKGKKRVFTPTGGLTWWLRKGWQLDGVLSDGDEKNRDDHRHHAVDAIIVALSDDSRVQTLSTAAAEAARVSNRRFMQALEFPWDKFTDTVREAIADINVSHRPTRTLAGPLHAESIYSKPIETANGIEYRIRKELHKLTEKEMSGDQIVDPTIRVIVQAKYAELGGRKPNMVFADPENHPSTTSGVPIHKVRIRADAKARSIGKGIRQRYVASGKDSNFASMVYAVLDEDGKEVRWEHEIITRLEAHERLNANRRKPGESVLAPDPEDPRLFKFALVKNDMLELDGPDGERVLYRVQSLSASEIQLCEHNVPNIRGANRTPFNRITSINSLRTRNAVVVTVSSTGQLRAKKHAAS